MKQHIPNSLTLGNLFFGVLASYLALTTKFSYIPVLFILAGGVLDFFDGFVARKLGVSSKLGKELDSLADLITFSVAPTFFLVSAQTYLGVNNLYYLLPLFLIPVGAGFRLAKFNLLEDTATPYFIGMPTPAVAVFLAAYAWMFVAENLKFNPLTHNLGLSVALFYLMNSKLKIFSLKANFKDKHIIAILITYILVSAILIYVLDWLATPFIFLFYIFFSYLAYRKTQKK